MPARDAASQDWSNHAALADALAETGVTVQDPHGLLPLPAGPLFIARASGTGTGVTEGDRITASFAPLAARRLGGQCAVYHTVEELPELADVCAAAPAVVFALSLIHISFCISQFNLIIMINSFKSLPHELEEAALIDGLGYWVDPQDHAHHPADHRPQRAARPGRQLQRGGTALRRAENP